MQDQEFWAMFEHWQNFKLFGLKNDWATYPKRYIEMLQTFESAYYSTTGKGL